jgi:hypothetical protein
MKGDSMAIELETKLELEEFRILLERMAYDFDEFNLMWPRVQNAIYQLQELPSKNPDKDGFFNVIYFVLTATHMRDGFHWLQQELGRKLNKLNRKETHESTQENAVCTTNRS